MKELNSQSASPRYEMIVTYGDNLVIDDIIEFKTYRIPLTYACSFHKLKTNMLTSLYNTIRNQYNKNYDVNLNIKLYQIDDTKNGSIPSTVNFLIERNLKVVSISENTAVDPGKNETQATFSLCDPVLFDMKKTYSYNRILTNVAASDIMKDYEESYIKTNRGDIFEIRKTGVYSEIKNTYVYEQILTSGVSDLDMPNFLINAYKPYHVPNIYFFDDFSLTSKKLIVCNNIAFSGTDMFKKADIRKYANNFMNLKMIKNVQFADVSSKINKMDPNLSITNTDSGNLKASDIPENKYLILGAAQAGNSITNNNYTSLHSSKNNPDVMNIYAQDNEINAEKRFKYIKECVNNLYDKMYIFEIVNSNPDFFDFGNVYNFDQQSLNSYVYTPINIAHVFYRSSFREPYLTCVTRTGCLKFSKKES